MSSRRRWVARLLLAVVSAACVLLLLEALCRLIVPEQARTVAVDRPLAVYAAQPSRQHPHSAGKTNVLRIAVVGDSLAMGPGDHRQDRFSNRLEWLLNLNDGVPPAEVETFARPSALYQQSKLLDRALERQPAIVIFAVNLNDVEDWRNPAALVRQRGRMTRRPQHDWTNPLMRRSVLVRQAVRATDTWARARRVRRYLRFLYAPGYSGLPGFREAAADFSGRCRSRGVAMAAVLFPAADIDIRAGRYGCEPMHAIVADAFARNGVPFLDLLETYRGFPGCRAYNIDSADDHLSEIGHRVAADAILGFLLREAFVPPEYAPRNIRDPTYNPRMFRKAHDMGYEVPPGF